MVPATLRFSLIGGIKFPAPIDREFLCKPLFLQSILRRFCAQTGQNGRNSLYFPRLAGKSMTRRVRIRLHAPPPSLTKGRILEIVDNSPPLAAFFVTGQWIFGLTETVRPIRGPGLCDENSCSRRLGRE